MVDIGSAEARGHLLLLDAGTDDNPLGLEELLEEVFLLRSELLNNRCNISSPSGQLLHRSSKLRELIRLLQRHLQSIKDNSQVKL